MASWPAATNRSDILDPALLRPGRLDRRIAQALLERESLERDGLEALIAGRRLPDRKRVVAA